MNRETLLSPVPIRFPEITRSRIRAAAKRFNLKTSDIVRQAVDAKLPEWERSGVLTIQSRTATE